MSIAGLILVLIPVLTISKREVKHAFAGDGGESSQCSLVQRDLTDKENRSGRPDIYYFIVDAYTNNQNLKKHFNYDNSPFIHYLKERGFTLPTLTSSNYTSTTLSISSAFHMDYINDLVEPLGEESEDRSILFDRVKDSSLRNFVKSKGYSFIHFISPFSIISENPCADRNVRCIYNNEFLLQLIKMSALSPFENFLNVVREDFRRGLLKTFSEIKKIADEQSPKFVFAHIITPHPPFLFGPNGEPREQAKLELDGAIWREKQAYVDQVQFINQKLEEIIEVILEKSDHDPIIILQADHGTFTSGDWENPSVEFLKERFGILNAIRLPDDGEEIIYASLTPVNSFRLIFNRYLEGDFDLLEDHNFYSTYEKPFKFTDVTRQVRS